MDREQKEESETTQDKRAQERQYMIWLLVAGVAMGLATRCASQLGG